MAQVTPDGSLVFIISAWLVVGHRRRDYTWLSSAGKVFVDDANPRDSSLCLPASDPDSPSHKED